MFGAVPALDVPLVTLELGRRTGGVVHVPLYSIDLTPVNVSQHVPGVAVEVWNGSLSPASQVTALAS